MCVTHRYIEGRSQTSYTTSCNGIVRHGYLVEVFGSLPATHIEINANRWLLHIIRLYLQDSPTYTEAFQVGYAHRSE